MNNVITLNQNSTRADRSKYLAQTAVSNGRHMITLREARENAGRSTKGAAEAVGITERTLKKWEIDCGRADSFAVDRLCKYYGISMDHIHAGKEADLLAARSEASKFLKHMGRDTTEFEEFLEEISESRKSGIKNVTGVGAPVTFDRSFM